MTIHFQLVSEMTTDDLATLGHTIGFSPTLDNPKAAKYQPVFASTNDSSGIFLYYGQSNSFRGSKYCGR